MGHHDIDRRRAIVTRDRVTQTPSDPLSNPHKNIPLGLRWLVDSSRLDDYIHPNIHSQGALETVRARLLLVLTFALCSSTPLVAFGYFRAQDYLGGGLLLAFGALGALSFLTISRFGASKLSAHLISFVLFGATTVGVYSLGGAESLATRWYALVPVLAGILGGLRIGGFWLFLSLVTFIAVVLAPGYGVEFPQSNNATGTPSHLIITMSTFMLFSLGLFGVSEFVRVWMVASLQEKDAQTNAILQSAPDGILIVNQLGEIERSNQVAEDLMKRGLTASALELYTSPHRTNALGDVELKTNDGQELCLEVRNARIDHPELEQLIVMLRDVTASRAMQQQLEGALQDAVLANAAKTRFLANMSHELRTPLNAIIGYAHILHEDLEDDVDEQSKRDINAILTAGQHLLSLIADVLDLAKIESGKTQLERRDFELVELLAELELTFSNLADAQENVLIFSNDVGDLTLHSDEQKLRQILTNLLSNATKFTTNGQISLRVSSSLENNYLIFEVSDSGIGMNEEQLERVWDEFTQADESTTRRYGGTGIGLALVKKLVAVMGGDIEAESALGQGSRFTMKLPMSALTNRPTVKAPAHARDDVPGQ